MERPRSRSWPNSVPLKLLLALMLASNFNLEAALGQPSQPGTKPSFPIARVPATAIAVRNNNTFALDLYRQLSQQEGNICVSPYSLSLALSMTYAGARNETAVEMARVLKFTLEPPTHLHRAMGQVATDLETNAGDQLAIANRLWLQEGLDLEAEFTQILAQQYRSPLAEVNFAGEPEQSRQAINQWIAQQTNEQVKDLLPPGAISAMTKLVLTNAIYFKGQWDYPFDASRTLEAPFYLDPESEVSVPMQLMQGAFPVAYAKLPELKLVELPYKGKALSMIVLLPVGETELATLEAQLTPLTLGKWLAAMKPTRTVVQLPRFKLASTFDLQSTLAQMGMTLPFNEAKADFSGIRPQKPLFISQVIQQAAVEVNEAGTEAAAATAVSMGRGGMSGFFRADRPFLFFIRDRRSGTILFMGRVTNPLD